MKCTKRVLRLSIPIIGTAILVFLLQRIVGFYNFAVQTVIQNTWLTHSYREPLTVMDILKEPFLVLMFGVSEFNAPFWCLKDMLVSSILIYVIRWLVKNVRRQVPFLVVLMALAVVANRNIIVACLVGAIAGCLKQRAQLITKKRIVSVGIIIPLIAFLIENYFIIDIGFACFLLAVSQIEQIKNLFELPVIQKLGSISFGVYALHWGVINTVGLQIIVRLSKVFELDFVMLISLICCTVLTIVLAFVFRETVEKMTAMLCRVFN